MAKSDRRRSIWKKANGLCAHCGKVTGAVSQTVDHAIPKSLGGGDDLRNLMPLCRKCNSVRGANNVKPARFYKYASRESISDLYAYRREWEASHMDSYGELIVQENEYGKTY